MLVMQLNQFKTWMKHHPNTQIRSVFSILKIIMRADISTPLLLNRTIYLGHKILSTLTQTIFRVFYHTPAFKGRVKQCGRRLYLYDGIPYVSGPLTIRLGDDCRVSGQTTFSGRTASQDPQLLVGNNVDIGWQTTIAVGQRIVIGDNVRIAGRAFLFGYSGHPLDAERRARGDGDDAHQTGNIILEKDVWLCTNVCVKHNVTIGEGTIVAAGSVVTHDLPAHVIAAGNPAKVIRHIKVDEKTTELEAAHA